MKFIATYPLKVANFVFKWSGNNLELGDRSHGPRNASGTETGTGSGKMGSMLEMEQYYMVRVWVRVQDREVGVPDPVPEAMGSRPIQSGIMSGL